MAKKKPLISVVRADHAPIPAEVGLRLGVPFAGRLACDRTVIAVLPDPDGQHIVAATAEGRLLRFAWPSGELVASRVEPDGTSYQRVAWMPDARSLLVARTTELRFHDPRTLELVRTVPVVPSRSGLGSSLQVLADGTIATFGENGRVVVFDPETAAVRGGLRMEGWIAGFAYTPDRKRAVAVTQERMLAVFEDERPTATATGFESPVAISADGRRFAAISSEDKHLVIHDTSSLEVIARIKPPERHGRALHLRFLSFTPDGRTVVAVGDVVGLVDVEVGGELRVLHATGGAHPTISSDGRLVAVAKDHTALVFDLVDGVEVHPPALGHERGIATVHGTRDQITSVDWSGRICFWDVGRPALRRALEIDLAGVRAMRFSPDGRLLAVADANRRVALVDPDTGATVRELLGLMQKPDTSSNVQLAFSPDGARVACGGFYADGAHVWDVATGQHLFALPHPKHGYSVIAFSPDGEQIVTGGEDKITRQWNARTGALVKELEGHKGAVLCVAVSPDDGTLVSGSRDGTVILWDRVTGLAREVLANMPFSGSCYELSPDGKYLLGAAIRGAVCLVPLAGGGRSWTVLEGHFGMTVGTAAFLPEGRIVTGGSDGSLVVWEPPTIPVAEPAPVKPPKARKKPTAAAPSEEMPARCRVRRFELTSGTSNKFWEVSARGENVLVRYGRIGTIGKGLESGFDSVAEARAKYERLVREKLREGYTEVPVPSSVRAHTAYAVLVAGRHLEGGGTMPLVGGEPKPLVGRDVRALIAAMPGIAQRLEVPLAVVPGSGFGEWSSDDDTVFDPIAIGIEVERQSADDGPSMPLSRERLREAVARAAALPPAVWEAVAEALPAHARARFLDSPVDLRLAATGGLGVATLAWGVRMERDAAEEAGHEPIFGRDMGQLDHDEVVVGASVAVADPETVSIVAVALDDAAQQLAETGAAGVPGDCTYRLVAAFTE